MNQPIEIADTQALQVDDVQGALAEEGEQRTQYVQRARVQYLYQQAKGGVLTTLAVGVILVFALHGQVSDASLWGWFTLLCLVTAARSLIVFAYHRQPRNERRRPLWRQAFVVGSAMGGAVWGMGGLIFAPQVAMEYQLLVYFVMGGMIVGAIPILAPILSAYCAFILPAIFPVVVWLLTTGIELHMFMAATMVVYGAAMIGVAKQYQKNSLQALSLAFENSDLVKRVSRARDEAQETNEQLEQEIVERKDAESALRKSETRFRSAFDNAPIAMALLDPDGQIFQVNRTFETMLGYPAEKLESMRFRDITHPDDIEESRERYRTLCEGKSDGYQLKKRYLHKDGTTIWGYLSVSVVRDGAGRPIYCIGQIQDVTESHTLSEELTYQASHDALTGLSNRREFERRLDMALRTAQEEDCEHALCYLDLDQFKIINDTCGHVAGDALLRQLGAVLKARLRRSDTIARLGGDEFGILIERCPMEEGRRVAEASLEAIRTHRFVWEDKSFAVGASVGLVPISGGEDSVTELLQLADSACYAAKDLGRNRIHFYEPGDSEIARRQGEMKWISRINSAIQQKRLRLVCQSIVPVSGKGDEGAHAELLLRMSDEDDPTKFHAPGAFLSAAERYDMASGIDRWVIDTAFDWITERAADLNSLKSLSINLSGRSLGDEKLLKYVTRRLKDGQFPPDKICFELTETAAIANLADAITFFDALRTLGCRFALDDFGSGLSSFAYLKSLPVDYLKIDGVFIRDIARDPISRAMVQSINDIGKVMGKQTIAEFVESAEIFEILRELGVDYAQGDFIGKPQPLLEMDSLSPSKGIA